MLAGWLAGFVHSQVWKEHQGSISLLNRWQLSSYQKKRQLGADASSGGRQEHQVNSPCCFCLVPEIILCGGSQFLILGLVYLCPPLLTSVKSLICSQLEGLDEQVSSKCANHLSRSLRPVLWLGTQTKIVHPQPLITHLFPFELFVSVVKSWPVAAPDSVMSHRLGCVASWSNITQRWWCRRWFVQHICP